VPNLRKFKVGKDVPRTKINTALEQLVQDRFVRLFEEWNTAKGSREGIHVSSIIKSDTDFCLRQIVLMQFFPHQPIPMFGRTLQIFRHGWSIHEKWQSLFNLAGLAEETETTHYHSETGASFTPDAIITLFKKRFLVEIKSMNAASYDSMKSVHEDARIQATMYMHLEGIRYAIILVENKDTQEFKLWIIEYEFARIRKYVRRLENTGVWLKLYKAERKLPNRHIRCISIDTPKARNCPVRDACFAGKFEREEMRKKYATQRRQTAKATD
jgi:hypothetical protein